MAPGQKWNVRKKTDSLGPYTDGITEFAGLENHGLENDGVEQEETYILHTKYVKWTQTNVYDT